MNLKKLIIVSGPTASGKSKFAIELAKNLNGEIINIDSVQVYKDFNIGSAKIHKEEQCEINHHLIDIIEPDSDFNVADYIKLADQIINNIIDKGKIPILVGGTTLYIKALLYGLNKLPETNSKIRDDLARFSTPEIYNAIKNFELDSAEVLKLAKIHSNDRYRLEKFYETYLLKIENPNFNFIDDSFKKSKYSALIILPLISREDLYKKINLRTKKMLDLGLVDEVKKIINKYNSDLKPLKSLGYKEVMKFLENQNFDLESEIAKNTRRYAKRQMTFWNNEPKKMRWIEFPNISSSSNNSGKSCIGLLRTGEKENLVYNISESQITSKITNIYNILNNEIYVLRFKNF